MSVLQNCTRAAAVAVIVTASAVGASSAASASPGIFPHIDPAPGPFVCVGGQVLHLTVGPFDFGSPCLPFF